MRSVPPAVPKSGSEIQRLFDLSLDLFCIAGFDGFFKRVNPAFERTLGYSSQELLSRPFLDLVHPDDLQASRDVLAAALRGNDVIGFENRVVCADGSVRWLQWNTRTIPDEGFVYGVARDVTDRRRADAELREAHQMVEASRDELRVLAEEQAALRRVATLVARGVPPDDVFAAVAEEVGRLMPLVETNSMVRYEADGTATVVASWSEKGMGYVKVGTHWTLDGESVGSLVYHTGIPARMDSYIDATGLLASLARESGIRSAAGAPIVVDGRLWGVMGATTTQPEPLPIGTELRLAKFTELVATAIANADSRANLTASRARIVAAADEARRRIERDLHDGAQQRLVSLALAVREAEFSVPPDRGDLREELSAIATGLSEALEGLQELSRGIHPAILSEGGLGPALRTLARRSAIPVDLDITTDVRLAESIEVAAYFVASEALANAAKHSDASRIDVSLERRHGNLLLSVRDDGVGGADAARGSGIVGLNDRVEALGGRIEITSPAAQGTSLLATIPIEAD